MPGLPCLKKKSPTMAPTTDRPAEMRRPAKMAGMAAGNSSLRRMVTRLGWCRAKRSRICRSTDRRPNRVLETIGNSEISTHTKTRALKPNPNQNPTRGTSARIGTHCRTTAYGKRAFSISRDCDMITAHVMPMIAAIARPVNATVAVRLRASHIAWAESPSSPSVTTWCGGGIRNRRPGSSTA